jgi:hypothetical protein
MQAASLNSGVGLHLKRRRRALLRPPRGQQAAQPPSSATEQLFFYSTRLAPAINSWARKVFHVCTHTSEGGVRGGTPAPRRLYGMRGADKTAGAGCGAHCVVRHGSSASDVGWVGGLGGLGGLVGAVHCHKRLGGGVGV